MGYLAIQIRALTSAGASTCTLPKILGPGRALRIRCIQPRQRPIALDSVNVILDLTVIPV